MRRVLLFSSLLFSLTLVLEAQVNPFYFDNKPYKSGHRLYAGAASGEHMFYSQRSAVNIDDTSGELHHFYKGEWKQLKSGVDIPGPAAVNDIVAHKGVFYFAAVSGLYVRQSNGQWLITRFPDGLIPLRVFVDDSVKVIRMNNGLMYQKFDAPWVHFEELGVDQMVNVNYRNFQGSIRRPVYFNDHIYVPFINKLRIFNVSTRQFIEKTLTITDIGMYKEPLLLTANSSQMNGLYFIDKNADLLKPSDKGNCWLFSGNYGVMAPKSILGGKNSLYTLVDDFNGGITLARHQAEATSLALSLKSFSLGKSYISSELLVVDEQEENIYLFSTGRKINVDDAFNRAQMPLQGTKVLEVNDISLPVTVLGEHGSDPLNPNIHPEMPKTSPDCVKTTYRHAALWIGGLDQGDQLHLSAMTYRQRGKDFVPGPLAVADGSVIPSAERAFNKVWKVSRSDIQRHIDLFARKGTVSQNETAADIWTWPGNGPEGAASFLAPFVDRNNNGLYEPNLGDYPDVPGDQCLYFVMNDQTLHTETGSLPLGVEIHGMVYAWNCQDPLETEAMVNRTVFFKYTIVNRSSNDYKQVVFSSFADVDISPFEDLAACHVTRNLFYGMGVKSGSTFQGFAFLNAPVFKHDGVDGDGDGSIDEEDERRYLGSFTTFNNDGTSSQGGTQSSYYRMLGLRQDGSPQIFGGPAGDSTERTLYAFSGTSNPEFPGKEWTEVSQGNTPGDRRLIGSTYPFDLRAGETVSVEMASFLIEGVVPGTAESSLFRATDQIKQWYYTKGKPECAGLLNANDLFSSTQPLTSYPNPAHRILYADTEHPEAIRILDLNGKEMNLKISIETSRVAINLDPLSSGVYFLSLTDAKGTRMARFIKL